MTITLTIGGKQRNMDRPKDELLEKPLGRLQKSAAPQPDRQQKRQKGKQGAEGAAAAAAAPPPAFVGLFAGPSADQPALDPSAVTNEEAWRQGRLLRVGEAEYQVEVNPPFLDRVEVHARAFAGIPLVPWVQVRQGGVRMRLQQDAWQAVGAAVCLPWRTQLQTPNPFPPARNAAAPLCRRGRVPLAVVPPATRRRRL